MKAEEYRRKYTDLQEQMIAFEARIRHRLKELINNHPDAIVGKYGDKTPIKAKSLNSPYYLDNMSINSTLQYMELIEQWLAEKEPYVQGKLFN